MTHVLGRLWGLILHGSIIGLLIMTILPRVVAAHEVLPAVVDMEQHDGQLTFELRVNLEALLAGVDLSVPGTTEAAPEAAVYDRFRKLSSIMLEQRFQQFWPQMAKQITIIADGRPASLALVSTDIPATGDTGLSRTSLVRFTADLPEGAASVQVGWDGTFGPLVLRQNGVEKPYDGYLNPGSLSPTIRLDGGDEAGAVTTFVRYVPIGFEHIVPKGLDHILFVLGLFFFNGGLRPLITQISAFTAAHTATLAAASLGYVAVPASIIEPAIAASIIYIAVENLLSKGESRWRLLVVFGFGLLHGLGFASVLQEFGLPPQNFISALIGFNVGVELGQITVIAVAMVAVGVWLDRRPSYRRVVASVASGLIALTGMAWAVERLA